MKNQIKKGLSLIMAVLMVLSCWVWVAPTEAEAADAVVTFPISITFKITQESGFGGTAGTDGGHVKVFYYEMNDDGTLDTSTRHERIIENSLEGWTSGTYTRTANIPGFPCGFGGEIDDNHAWFNVILQITDFTVAGKSVASVSQFNNARIEWFYDGTGTKADVGGDNESSDSSVWNSATRNWPTPNFQPSGFSSEAKTLSIPEYGSTNTVATDAINFTFKDSNYPNATWNLPFAFTLGKTSSDLDNSATVDGIFYYDSSDKKVKATAEVQAYHPIDANSYNATKTFYLIANDGVNTDYQQINLTYPTYKVEWLADASVESTPTTTVYGNDGTKYTASAAKYSTNFYGQDVAKKYAGHPTGEATKEGYTFYGFWSKQQPGTKADGTGAYAFEADFVMPMTSDEYSALTEEQKASGKYYDAGIKYDPKDSSTTEVTGHMTWYGWWLSDDISVKFYDVDGTFLQENAVKYNYTNSQITWPNNDVTQQYVSGSYSYDNFTGVWFGADGEEVNSTGYTFTHDLILTPKYNTVSFTSKYTVSFVNSFGSYFNGDSYSKEYTYRTQPDIPSSEYVIDLNDGDDYSYEFVGWASSNSSVLPLGGKNYHVILEDGDFDEEGNAIYLINDFTVRDNVTYYPVFRQYLKSHDVSFVYPNSKGEWPTEAANYKKVSFKYGEVITAPDDVPTEYATGGYGYTFLGWTTNGTDLINLNEKTCIPNLTFRAKYSDGVATPYTITFVYKNEKGEDVSESIQVTHGSTVASKNTDFVTALADKVAETYDDGTALNTFYGNWVTADGETLTADGILEYKPENHVTFTAEYTNPQLFYTVTYKDGSATKTFRIVTGTALPFWTVTTTEGEGEDAVEKTETYLPTRDDTESGFYTFKGWYDAEEGGNAYTPGTTVITSNVTLYPQFDFGEFEYYYVFLNWDGTELGKFTYHYNASVDADREKMEALVDTVDGVAGAQARPADNTYTYTFLGWDKVVPSHCEGGEPGTTITFTAQYKPVYIMYKANWYNSIDDLDAGNAPLATQSYVYGERMRTPSVVTTPNITVPDGQTAVFAGWYYKDSEGTEHAYTKQLTNAGDINFYAKYKLTAKIHTVTVVVSDNESYTISVADGETINENMIVEPASGYVDATKHNEFKKWTIDALENGAVFEIGTTIVNKDITLYANFEESEHELTNSEVLVLPTYTANAYTDSDGTVVAATTGEGSMQQWCSCHKENTAVTTEIPPLTDKVAPGATIYLGTQWNSDSGFADTNETQAYLGKNSAIIITTSDMGDEEATYNASGKGIGVESIYAIVSEDTFDAASEAFNVNPGTNMYSWQQIQKSLISYYNGWANVPAVYKDYNANASLTAEGFGLEDGETYTAYFKVTDKAGNVSYFKSAPFVYDTTLPVGSLEGDKNVTGDKFCEQVVIKASDANLASVTANGTALEYDEEAGGYVISKIGTYNVTATDKAGNKINTYFSVIDHQKASVTTLATCTADGYVATTCLSCGKKFEITEEIECTGHLDLKTVHTDATCIADGYDTITCSACGLDETNYVDADGNYLYPQLGHNYSDWVTTKDETCTADGLQKKTCSRCGDVQTQEIVKNDGAHSWYTVKVVKATCTLPGERSRTCRICGYKEILETIPATGHTASGKYKVLEDSTCAKEGTEIELCSVCDLPIEGKTRAITTLKAHTWVLDESKTVEPQVGVKGSLTYVCSVCDAEHTVEVDAIVEYTVNFYNEDGSPFDTKTVTSGESVTTTTSPTKADSADGKTRYTFTGWYTEEGTKYTLPMTVTKDINLYAKFNSSDITYTILFSVPTTYDAETDDFGNLDDYKRLMGAIGDTREPAADPTMAETDYFTFTFDYWMDTQYKKVEEIVINGTDSQYIAHFTAVPKTCLVIFMEKATDEVALGYVTVNAGEDAEYPVNEDGSYKFGTPEKAFDDNYHYTFKGWDKDLKNITSKTTVYAQFNAIEHTFDEGTVTQEANCLLPEMTTYKCACGYEKTVQTDDALGHLLGDAVYDEATGENVQKCTREGCYYEKREKASYTIKFKTWDGLLDIKTLTVEAHGAVVFDYDNITIPEKKADAEYSYTFKGWVDSDGNEYSKDATLPNATADVIYKAVYTAVTRTYRVTYVDSNNNVLYTKDGISYGDSVPAPVGVDTSAIEVPTWNNNQHFVFDSWSVSTDATVTSDIVIKPVFKGVDHEIETTTGEANCTEPGGIVHTCKAGCGYKYIDGNVPALGHDLKVVDRKDPTINSDGYIKYVCQREGCGYEYTETLPAKQPITINVTVKDTNGNLISGATVELYMGNTFIDDATSGANGVATFTVYEEGEYYVIIKNIPGYSGQIEGTINVGEGSNNVTTGENLDQIYIPSCTCSCHKTSFWGMLFRFFHKIIKLFAGEYICCACPDEAYN